ncbi:MAG: GDP-mannose 4,6-dehydratase [Chlamydiales bacterium]
MNFWQNRSVFITGATGLIGYHLTQALVDVGALVTALVRDNDPQTELFRTALYTKVAIVNGSLETDVVERVIVEQEIDTIFHLGAQTIVGRAKRHPLQTFESNIRGTYLLLEAFRRQRDFVRTCIVASTDKAYGSSAKLPYTENTPLKGEYPYDVSKTCCDLIAQSYAKTYDLPLSIVRCGNIFGGGDLNFSRIVPGTIRSLLNGERPIIRSDGTLLRDYFYVKDAVSGYLQLAQSGVSNEAFNFGSTRPCTVLEITRKISELMESDLKPIILDEASCEIKEQYLCCEKAKKILDWKPCYTLEEGLQETIAWYEAFIQKRLTLV